MAVRAIVLLTLLACLTVRQQGQWVSDVALWGRAVRVNATSPRPAYNYAVALRKAGNLQLGAWWLSEAARRVSGGQVATYEPLLTAQVVAFEMAGHPVCDSPSLRPYC